MAVFTPRFLRQLRDVLMGTPADGEVLTYDVADGMWKPAAGGGGGGPPTGAAGGVLGGTYPNPAFAADMATQVELDAHVTDATAAHAASAISADSTTLVGTGTDVQAVLEELDNAVAAADPAGSVILAPATSARNTIAPAANAQAFRIVATDGADASKNMIEAYRSGAISGANFVFDIDAGGGSAWNLKDPVAKFEIDLATGKTTDGFVVYSGDLDQFSGFDKRARLFTQITTAPADADVDTGEIVFWYDKTNGAAKWMAKGKTANGTVVTWEIPNGIIGLKSALDDHLADAADAHDASAISFSPTGTVAATDVQAAIAEVASEASGAPTTADYLVGTAQAGLSAEIVVPAFALTLIDDTTAVAARATLAAATFTPPHLPTGALAATFDRRAAYISTIAVLVSQRVTLAAIELQAGMTVTSISWLSGTNGLATGVHQYFGLYDASRNLLAATADATSAAWNSLTVKTLNLTAPYAVTGSGLYYIGVLVDATTVPTLLAADSGRSEVKALAPIIAGSSSTGQTSLPNPAAAITATAQTPFGYVS